MVLLLGVVLLFAATVTTHVWLCLTLLRSPRRWRSALALIVVPLAPYWCWNVGKRKMALTWILLTLAYAGALATAMR